jgi:hypothetical protein
VAFLTAVALAKEVATMMAKTGLLKNRKQKKLKLPRVLCLEKKNGSPRFPRAAVEYFIK